MALKLLKDNQSGIAVIILVLIGAAVLVVSGAAIYRFTHHAKGHSEVAVVTPQPTPTPTPKPTVTASAMPSPTVSPIASKAPTATPIPSDKSLIILALKSYGATADATLTTVDFSTDGKNAHGSATSDATGPMVFYAHKNSDGSWFVIYSGQSQPDASLGAKYNLPDGWFIPAS